METTLCEGTIRKILHILYGYIHPRFTVYSLQDHLKIVFFAVYLDFISWNPNLNIFPLYFLKNALFRSNDIVTCFFLQVMAVAYLMAEFEEEKRVSTDACHFQIGNKTKTFKLKPIKDIMFIDVNISCVKIFRQSITAPLVCSTATL